MCASGNSLSGAAATAGNPDGDVDGISTATHCHSCHTAGANGGTRNGYSDDCAYRDADIDSNGDSAGYINSDTD